MQYTYIIPRYGTGDGSSCECGIYSWKLQTLLWQVVLQQVDDEMYITARSLTLLCCHCLQDKAVSPEGLAAFTVVLTTYGTMAQEAPLKDRQAVKLKRQGQNAAAALLPTAAAADSGLDGQDILGSRPGSSGSSKGGGGRASAAAAAAGGGCLFQVLWHRVVLDEAQSIKNAQTLAAHAAWSLHARHRWCLSGTPIQNSVDDLFSYFK